MQQVRIENIYEQKNLYVFFLDPVADLEAMLLRATNEVNDALGIHTFNDAWRKRGRKRLARCAEKMINDYVNRRDNHNCDPNARNIVESELLDDDIERALPEACKEIAKPVKTLSQDARAWSNQWNSCGDGKDRQFFRQRIWKTLRSVRRTAYENMGCF